MTPPPTPRTTPDPTFLPTAPPPTATPRTTPPGAGAVRDAVRRIGGGLLLSLTVAVAVLVPLPYLTRSLPDLAASQYGLAQHYAGQPTGIRAALLVHVAAGGVALLLTAVQATAWIRRRALAVHRVLGYVAAGAILAGAAAGLVIAQVSYAGPVGTLGFSALSLLWILSAARTVLAARSGHRATHRAWAVRTVALSAAAITLRIWVPLLIVAQRPSGDDAVQIAFDRAYALVPFLCWVPNLLVAEWLVRRHTTRHPSP